MYMNKENRLQLEEGMLDRWSWLTEGLEGEDKINTSMVLQNSYESMIEADQLQEGWLEALLNEDELNEAPQISTSVGSNVIPKVLFPVIRRVMPALIANQIVSVQPIAARTGIIYNISFTYSDSKGAITAGDEYTGNAMLGSPAYATFYSSEKVGPFTITVPATLSEGSVATNTEAFFGTDTSEFTIKRIEVYKDGAALAVTLDSYNQTAYDSVSYTTGNVAYTTDGYICIDDIANVGGLYEEGDVLTVYLVYDQEGSSKIPEMEFSINSESVETTERKLKIRWTKEAEQDMKAYHKIDVESELVKIASMEMNYEIDRELLSFISDTVPTALSYTHNWMDDGAGDGTADSGNNTAGNYLDRHRALAQKIALLSSKIAQYNRQGAANWAIVSPQVASVLAMLPNFKGEISGSGMNIQAAGVLAGNIKIYVDPNNASNEILMGYKSNSSVYGAGVVYSPYTNWMSNTVTHPDNFNSVRGFFSRYAVHKVIRGEWFYGKLTVENLDLV